MSSSVETSPEQLKEEAAAASTERNEFGYQEGQNTAAAAAEKTQPFPSPKPATQQVSEARPQPAPKSKKRKVKYKKPAQAPRRFKSAYMFFSTAKHKEIRARLGKQGQAEKTTQIAKMVSQEWKSLAPDEREVWEEMARRDKARYEMEKAVYTGPWRVPAKRRSPKDPNAPKRPMSAFLSFAQTRRPIVKKENPQMSNIDVSRLLAKMWKDAPNQIRKEHIEKEQKLRDEYKEAMAEWKDAQEKEFEDQRQEMEASAMRSLAHARYESQQEASLGAPQASISDLDAIRHAALERANAALGASAHTSAYANYPSYLHGMRTTYPSTHGYYSGAANLGSLGTRYAGYSDGTTWQQQAAYGADIGNVAAYTSEDALGHAEAAMYEESPYAVAAATRAAYQDSQDASAYASAGYYGYGGNLSTTTAASASTYSDPYYSTASASASANPYASYYGSYQYPEEEEYPPSSYSY